MINKEIGLAVSLKNIMLSLWLRTIFFKTYSLTSILVYHAQSIQFFIKLGQSDHYLDHYSHTRWWGHGSLWCHWGQERSFSLKRHQFLQTT